MLRAKAIHGADKLASMIVLCAFPYIEPLEDLQSNPLFYKYDTEDGRVSYFCGEHQFRIYASYTGDGYIEFRPEWHCYGKDADEKEKAICTLTGIFEYCVAKRYG